VFYIITIGSEKEIHVSNEIRDRVKRDKFGWFGVLFWAPSFLFSHAILGLHEELAKLVDVVEAGLPSGLEK
jgi:hypothetical protein